MMEAGRRESGRTVVVSGVPGALPARRMLDKLTVHFQSYRRSHGGDVEEVSHRPGTDGVAFVTFDRAEGNGGNKLTENGLKANI